jgi:hypothetical protein
MVTQDAKNFHKLKGELWEKIANWVLESCGISTILSGKIVGPLGQ